MEQGKSKGTAAAWVKLGCNIVVFIIEAKIP